MTSNVKRGNYYKKRTKDYYLDLGYEVINCEVAYTIFTPKGVLYRKRDLLGADLIAYNEKEFILVNAKSTIQGKKGVVDMKKKGSDEFKKFNLPDFIKKELCIWQPRQKPLIIKV